MKPISTEHHELTDYCTNLLILCSQQNNREQGGTINIFLEIGLLVQS